MASAVERVVVVGAGQGGFQVAASLRALGFGGTITLVGDETGLPYQRPPLSKTFLVENRSDKLLFRPRQFFVDNDITVLEGQRVEEIDRTTQNVRLANGEELPYDHLVLATGTRNRPLPIEGADLDNVVELRTLAHAENVSKRLRDAKRVVVVGGGFIGLELATATARLGADVTVFEAAHRLMARAVSLPISDRFQYLHERMGVRVRLRTTLAAIHGDKDGRVRGVETSDGSKERADLVIVGIGVVPNVELAERAGLACENGVVVGDTMLTDDPNISAIGDCASHIDSRSNARLRLESVQNAADQAKVVAARLTGKPYPYTDIPWFWSDQAGAKLQIAGLATDGDSTLVVGHPDDTSPMHVITFKNDAMTAVEAVDAPAQYMAGRRLLEGEAVSRSDVERAAGDLREVMKAQRARAA